MSFYSGDTYDAGISLESTGKISEAQSRFSQSRWSISNILLRIFVDCGCLYGPRNGNTSLNALFHGYVTLN